MTIEELKMVNEISSYMAIYTEMDFRSAYSFALAVMQNKEYLKRVLNEGSGMNVMNLDEAISSYEKNAKRYHKAFLHCKAHGGEFYQSEAESNRICAEHDRQLAAWLRELQERRKEPEIITCGECAHRYVEGNHVRFNRCELNHNNVQSDDWYCADAGRRADV